MIYVRNISCHIVFLAGLVSLSACEQQRIPSTDTATSRTLENAKEKKVWFNLFLPEQTAYELTHEALGFSVSFANFKTKDTTQKPNIDIDLSPDAISFYAPKFYQKGEPVWLIIESSEGQFIELKVKVLPIKALEVTTGESASSSDFLMLEGFNPTTSTRNSEDIKIGWTHQAKFDLKLSSITLSYFTERYDPKTFNTVDLTDSFTFILEENTWTIDETSFSNFIKDIPVENISISINLISNDHELAEIFEFKFYKATLQKKVLIAD